jgi:hypothetical protein
MVGYFFEYFAFQVRLFNQGRITETIKKPIEEKMMTSNTVHLQ